MDMLRLLGRRMGMAVPLLIVVSSLTFVMVSLTGDAASELLGIDAPPGAHERLREELGLDLPLYQQYADWLRSALAGDLGSSVFRESETVTGALADRAPVTLSLVAGALLVSVVVGVGLGVLSAVRGGIMGRAADVVALVGWALPSFWVGAMLIGIFVHVGLPATGYVALTESPVGWLRSVVLPIGALSLAGVAAVTKQTREAMLDALGSEYVRMAWANGIPPHSVWFKHALKNAGIRVVTILGLLAVTLLGGTVLVESVFAVPGLGSLAVTAALRHDLPMVQGVVVLFTVIVLLVNVAIDLAYTWLNPRVRLA